MHKPLSTNYSGVGVASASPMATVLDDIVQSVFAGHLANLFGLESYYLHCMCQFGLTHSTIDLLNTYF